MPSYSVIDGDISDFFDALMDMTTEFRTDELRRYLLAASAFLFSRHQNL